MWPHAEYIRPDVLSSFVQLCSAGDFAYRLSNRCLAVSRPIDSCSFAANSPGFRPRAPNGFLPREGDVYLFRES